MSSDEDDYMSDKFLGKDAPTSEDIRPSLIKLKRDKRQLEIFKKKIKLAEPKRAVKEASQRQKGLETAISSENKGFQMLAKMGYKPGTSLGKTNEGIVEPINVIVKKDTKGVGVSKQRTAPDPNLLERLEGDFKRSVKQRMSMRELNRNFKTAQTSCEHFDSKNDINEPEKVYYWPKEIMEKRFGKKKKKKESSDEEEEDSEEEDEQAYQKYITIENLENILEYLRTKYFYCIFCASIGTSEEDLNSFCPGPSQHDHDE